MNGTIWGEPASTTGTLPVIAQPIGADPVIAERRRRSVNGRERARADLVASEKRAEPQKCVGFRRL